jgi:hypothetical protein
VSATDHVVVESPNLAMKLPSYPLLFNYRDTVFGNGYVAEVVVTNGRVLAAHEDEEIWFYGVNPGGIAAPGESPDAAGAAFRSTFRNALSDFAATANTFEDFRREVERFFAETNAPTEIEWNSAVAAVREGKIDAKGLERKPAESPRSITVLLKQAFSARDNETLLERVVAA